jgi:peptide/nickel transport system permease protein
MRLVLGRLAGAAGVVLAVTATAWLLLAVLRPDLFPPDPRSLPVRLGETMWDAARFRFGQSTELRGRPDAAAVLRAGVPVDLQLLLGGIACGLALGIGTAVACAGQPDGPLAQVAGAVAIVAQCVPVYVVGLFLLLTFGERIGTAGLPVGIPLQYVELGEGGPVRWLAAIAAPWIVLALPLAGITFRMMRGSMREAGGEDFLLAARAKGVGPAALRLRHQGRFALAPTLTLAGAATNATLINLAIVERIFGASGSFRRLDDAVATADAGLLLGLTFLIALYVTVAGLVIDLALRMVDPRIGAGART